MFEMCTEVCTKSPGRENSRAKISDNAPSEGLVEEYIGICFGIAACDMSQIYGPFGVRLNTSP